MKLGRTLYVKDRKSWRAWLRKNHKTQREIWLVYPRKHTGRPRIPYNDAVEEALCFGWIDSTLKSIDDDRFAQRFSPRRKGSELSALNRERVRVLMARRKMTRAGLAVLPSLVPSRLVVPAALREALAGNPAAKKRFEALPASYKRIRLGYIQAGRKHGEAEYRKRIRHFVDMTAQGKRIGLWQGLPSTGTGRRRSR